MGECVRMQSDGAAFPTAVLKSFAVPRQFPKENLIVICMLSSVWFEQLNALGSTEDNCSILLSVEPSGGNPLFLFADPSTDNRLTGCENLHRTLRFTKSAVTVSE